LVEQLASNAFLVGCMDLRFTLLLTSCKFRLHRTSRCLQGAWWTWKDEQQNTERITSIAMTSLAVWKWKTCPLMY